MGKRFNPQSLNLYDEGTKATMELKELIGISLDQHILGNRTLIDSITKDFFQFYSDYVTLQEFLSLCKIVGIEPEAYLGTNYLGQIDQEFHTDAVEIIDDEDKEKRIGLLDQKEAHLRRIAQTIIHLINVGFEVTEEPWNYIAIGSDFDGLIDAVNICPTAVDIPNLKLELIKHLKLDHAWEEIQWQRTGIKITSEKLLKKIFEENVINFYKNLNT